MIARHPNFRRLWFVDPFLTFHPRIGIQTKGKLGILSAICCLMCADLPREVRREMFLVGSGDRATGQRGEVVEQVPKLHRRIHCHLDRAWRERIGG